MGGGQKRSYYQVQQPNAAYVATVNNKKMVLPNENSSLTEGEKVQIHSDKALYNQTFQALQKLQEDYNKLDFECDEILAEVNDLKSDKQLLIKKCSIQQKELNNLNLNLENTAKSLNVEEKKCRSLEKNLEASQELVEASQIRIAELEKDFRTYRISSQKNYNLLKEHIEILTESEKQKQEKAIRDSKNAFKSKQYYQKLMLQQETQMKNQSQEIKKLKKEIRNLKRKDSSINE